MSSLSFLSASSTITIIFACACTPAKITLASLFHPGPARVLLHPDEQAENPGARFSRRSSENHRPVNIGVGQATRDAGTETHFHRSPVQVASQATFDYASSIRAARPVRADRTRRLRADETKRPLHLEFGSIGRGFIVESREPREKQRRGEKRRERLHTHNHVRPSVRPSDLIANRRSSSYSNIFREASHVIRNSDRVPEGANGVGSDGR